MPSQLGFFPYPVPVTGLPLPARFRAALFEACPLVRRNHQSAYGALQAMPCARAVR